MPPAFPTSSRSRSGPLGRTLRLVLAALFLVAGTAPLRAADPASADEAKTARVAELFGRENLVAWCIVPFDAKKRTPEQRVAMLKALGFRRFAYDWRGEHLPTFDHEVELLQKEGIELSAVWFPGGLDASAKTILEVLKKRGVKTQLWVTGGGGPTKTPEEQKARVAAEAKRLQPICAAADEIGCTVALYNHGGWFGEPENQLEILASLAAGTPPVKNVGIVYNLHHGHAHLDRFAKILDATTPHLFMLNLNGMYDAGEARGAKIVPLGQGARDLELLQAIVAGKYRGRIGILGHTQDDAEARLKDNLDGLDWLVPQLLGSPAAPKPVPRTPSAKPREVGAAPQAAPAVAAKAVPAKQVALQTAPASPAGAAKPADPQTGAAVPAAPAAVLPYDPAVAAALLKDARDTGDPRAGARVVSSVRFACVSCHKVGALGGTVGPELTALAKTQTAEQIVESLLWPKRVVKDEYQAWTVVTVDGKSLQGYRVEEDKEKLVLKQTSDGAVVEIPLDEIDEKTLNGTLMPEGLAAAMTPIERRDVVRFLLDLGAKPELASLVTLPAHPPAPEKFSYVAAPLHGERWPYQKAFVNRDRLYDFYAKEAEYFAAKNPRPLLVPEYPGLDGGSYGHWGNQKEEVWADDRWNSTDVGSLLAGVFRGCGKTIPKGVCVRLGDAGDLGVCFNPQTLSYEALWQGGFLKFSKTRHGFVDAIAPLGTPLPAPAGDKPQGNFQYHGFYRYGKRVVFAYRLNDVEMLDSPWAEGGKFVRTVAPADQHPLAAALRGGKRQWPEVFTVKGELGKSDKERFVVDTIPLPTENPWKALVFPGDHAFLPDGTAFVCTMQGDVWRAVGVDETLAEVRWNRFAAGLNHSLGMLAIDGKLHVLGRDQITRLEDRDGDGEADYYHCVSNAYTTSPAGHDFICGLERDAEGNFLTASGNEGVLKISPDGKRSEVVAAGFRNPDGIGLTPDGTVTVPCSEGDWTPSSMICEVRPGGWYGYRGPKNNLPPDLPLVYLPRGLDNSSGAQSTITSPAWGALQGKMVHTSFGACTWFLLLRDKVGERVQGAVVPLPGEFASGAHRARFSPKDGQLYVSGMAGWGNYASADGCFHRIRLQPGPLRLPLAWKAHQNGVAVTFSEPLDREFVEHPSRHFVQAWNYRYGPGYGSPEFSARHFGLRGHDVLDVASAKVLADGKTLFLEIPDLQPVNQLHLHLKIDDGEARELFATVHQLDSPRTDVPGYVAAPKTVAAHPIFADLAFALQKSAPNPWSKRIGGARQIVVEAGKNLTFATRTLRAAAGETLVVKFVNPDVVPHNWVLLKPGSLQRVGELVNRAVADPEAPLRHYVPKTDDVLHYTDIVSPQDQATIFFKAPKEKGRYPFLCSFPGHWMVMNGELIVE